MRMLLVFFIVISNAHADDFAKEDVYLPVDNYHINRPLNKSMHKIYKKYEGRSSDTGTKVIGEGGLFFGNYYLQEYIKRNPQIKERLERYFISEKKSSSSVSNKKGIDSNQVKSSSKESEDESSLEEEDSFLQYDYSVKYNLLKQRYSFSLDSNIVNIYGEVKPFSSNKYHFEFNRQNFIYYKDVSMINALNYKERTRFSYSCKFNFLNGMFLKYLKEDILEENIDIYTFGYSINFD